MSQSATPIVAAHYFDGRSARPVPVQLHLAAGRLHIEGPGVCRAEPVSDVRWPERTRHGARVAHLADGASVHCADALAWDGWARTSGLGETLVVKVQQSWHWVVVSVLLLAVLIGAGYQWGVPSAARMAVGALPHSVDVSVGETALATLDERVMRPSALPLAQQRRIVDAFERAVAALPAGSVPAYRIVFRQSRIGANAFALPGGTIVMTDELVQRVGSDDSILVGVLGHELGHLRHRHGLRLLAQVGALGALAGVLVGDFSTLLAGVPLWLGQAGYSRDAEREADAEALRLLQAAGLSPLAMVRFFDTMAKAGANGREAAADHRDPSWLGIAIASHPADEERIRFFRAAAQLR